MKKEEREKLLEDVLSKHRYINTSESLKVIDKTEKELNKILSDNQKDIDKLLNDADLDSLKLKMEEDFGAKIEVPKNLLIEKWKVKRSND